MSTFKVTIEDVRNLKSEIEIDPLNEKLLDVDEKAYKGWRRSDGLYKKIISSQMGGVLCARLESDEKLIVGHLVWHIPFEEQLTRGITAESVYITTLVVFPEYQRKGIGKQLMKVFFDTVAIHFPNVRLHVRWNNIPGLTLYLSLAFTIEACIENMYSQGTHAFLMVKKL